MSSTLVVERNPLESRLERTLQNWVQQAACRVGAPEFEWRVPGQAAQYDGPVAPAAPLTNAEVPSMTARGSQSQSVAHDDWEDVLRRSNAANDEMCSENGRLRAEIERLRVEERNAAGSSETSQLQNSTSPEAFETELLTKVAAAVREVIADRRAEADAEVESRDVGDGASAQCDAEVIADRRAEADAEVESRDVGDGASAQCDAEVTGAEERIVAAMRAAFQEEADSSTPAPALTPAEETAVLVGERVALRELVERQNERIRALTAELREAGAAQPAGVLSNAASAISMYTQGISDAVEARKAEVKDALAPKEKRGAAIMGAEYEVIGRRGTIVRNGESLRSETVADLPPGSRVRVVGLSEKYPRRVEIICIRNSGGEGDGAPKQAEAEGACENAVADAPPDGENSSLAAADPAAVSLITGWISACDKEGRMLIRLAPKKAETCSGSDVDDDREEGNEEIADVTLSQDEWQALHQDSEASMKKVENLTSRLNKMGCELLQSFEMKSVLGELLHSVERAQERCGRMGELAAMTQEELEQRRMAFWRSRHAAHEAMQTAEADAAVAASNPSGATPATSSHAGVHGDQAKDTSPTGDRIGSVEKVDWDRLMTERETTAAALSAGLQRLGTLEREVKELDDEREILDSRDKKDLGGLRASLRRRAKPMMAAMSKVFHTSSPTAAAGSNAGDCAGLADVAAAEGLFKRRIEDLQAQIAELQEELSRANANERVIRKTIKVRKTALRSVLHQGATRDLAIPQCGPLQLKVPEESERRALQLAVEEQLNCNLDLHAAHGLPHRRPLAMLAVDNGI